MALWNIAFFSALALLIAVAGSGVGETLLLGFPFVLGVWCLVLGKRFAHRRLWVWVTAGAGGLLFLLQCLLLAFFAWYNAGFGNTTAYDEALTLLILAVAAGSSCVWIFLNAKLPAAKQ